MCKRILSIALSAVMLVCTLGMSVMAAGSEADGGVGMVNPIKKYDTFAELQKAVDFTISLPTLLPKGYQASGYATIGGDLAQVTYTNEKGNKILYRVAPGEQDISGDYTVYKKESTLTYGDVTVTLKGSKTVAKLATWSKDKLSYSLALENGLKWKSMELVMDSMLKPKA